MANPFDAGRAAAGCQRAELIPVEAERLALGGIRRVAGEITLAGDQVRLAVAVQVNQGGSVRLGPGVVDKALSPRTCGALLDPEHAVGVRHGGQDVASPVLIISRTYMNPNSPTDRAFTG